MASSTQSVGVPSTAKRRGPSWRTRSGRVRVSEWLAPLCSCSGPTTQTSLLRLWATRASSLMPGASIPSSLQTRIRACARSIPSPIGAQTLHTPHIGPQRRRNCDRAVFLLVVLDHRDQCPPDRKAGAVEGVDEAIAPCLFVGALFRLETRIHPPRLELAALRAARNLAIGVLCRQPDLDVVGLARREAHIAGAQQHHAIRQIEPLEDLFGTSGHALMLLMRLVGMRDRDELNLVELMLPDHAARVLASGARFRTE